jgi:FkbM family methyltransferase
MILLYRKLYRNYINVYKDVSCERYPIEAIRRNGNCVLLRNYLEVQKYDGSRKGFDYEITNDFVTLPVFDFHHKMINITIYGGTDNGDIKDIFVDNIYQYLPVKNKIVIDIGANIADSSIYFALRGASKIIGLEPFPKNYELAQKNINLNNFSNKINLFLAGCSGNKDEITIDPDYNSGINSILKDFKLGIKVPILTLGDILNENKLMSDGSIILKMDCEGCEYEAILSAEKNTLQKFSHVMIEYHYGYKDLKKKLERSGFRVSVTRPRIYHKSPDKFHGKVNAAEGYIFARR